MKEEADALKKKGRAARAEAKEELDRAEEEGLHLWEIAKEYVLRPSVWGGFFGIGECFFHSACVG